MEETLRSLIKEAMIERKNTGQTLRYQTYKNILEKAQKTAKDKKIETLTDDLIYDAAKKEIKQLEDTLQYLKPEDARYFDTTTAISYAKELLPAMVTKEEMLNFLRILSLEKSMGLCMKTLKEHYGSSCDGKTAQEATKEYISL